STRIPKGSSAAAARDDHARGEPIPADDLRRAARRPGRVVRAAAGEAAVAVLRTTSATVKAAADLPSRAAARKQLPRPKVFRGSRPNLVRAALARPGHARRVRAALDRERLGLDRLDLEPLVRELAALGLLERDLSGARLLALVARVRLLLDRRRDDLRRDAPALVEPELVAPELVELLRRDRGLDEPALVGDLVRRDLPNRDPADRVRLPDAQPVVRDPVVQNRVVPSPVARERRPAPRASVDQVAHREAAARALADEESELGQDELFRRSCRSAVRTDRLQ
ncbi:MAG: hypothetical protein ACTHOU_16935, partial [Aureliella sp.]